MGWVGEIVTRGQFDKFLRETRPVIPKTAGEAESPNILCIPWMLF